MNLQRLFEMQEQLDADILAHHPVQEGEDRLSKKVLALLVELGECAQEWRGFKFWSNDQEPRTEQTCESCEGKGYKRRFNMHDGERRKVKCSKCEGTGTTGNPLLEEYVDCLHFILSIGNDLKVDIVYLSAFDFCSNHQMSLEKYFTTAFANATAISEGEDIYNYFFVVFVELGHKLGFAWEQIEQAYYKKNKTNFERQKNGY